MSDDLAAPARWLPGDECPSCLGHGVVEVRIPITVCCENARPSGECCGNGREDWEYDVEGCAECQGVGTLKPLPLPLIPTLGTLGEEKEQTKAE